MKYEIYIMSNGTVLRSIEGTGKVRLKIIEPEKIKIEILGTMVDLTELLESHTPGCTGPRGDDYE